MDDGNDANVFMKDLFFSSFIYFHVKYISV